MTPQARGIKTKRGMGRILEAAMKFSGGDKEDLAQLIAAVNRPKGKGLAREANLISALGALMEEAAFPGRAGLRAHEEAETQARAEEKSKAVSARHAFVQDRGDTFVVQKAYHSRVFTLLEDDTFGTPGESEAMLFASYEDALAVAKEQLKEPSDPPPPEPATEEDGEDEAPINPKAKPKAKAKPKK